jgi:hypothetical protein
VIVVSGEDTSQKIKQKENKKWKIKNQH